MNKKLRKAVFELSKNSRIRTKELGKALKTSQQSASYLISSLRDRNIIQEHNTIIDPSKLGYINILVYYNFSDFTAQSMQEILSFLKKEDSVVSIEQMEKDYDLACTFCVSNLSSFNKINRDFLQNFRNKIFVADIFPIVVKHIYQKTYLSSQKYPTEIIISGDRDIVQMTENEKRVATLLHKDPTIKIVELARKLKLNPKTIIKVKKRLERRKIIGGYSTLWNYKILGIDRKHILISTEELSLKEDKRLLDFARTHTNITRLIRLIGRFDLLAVVEGENLTKKDILKELRSEFKIKRFKVIESNNIIKKNYVPSAALAIE